jgi:hypothetical protein
MELRWMRWMDAMGYSSCFRSRIHLTPVLSDPTQLMAAEDQPFIPDALAMADDTAEDIDIEHTSVSRRYPERSNRTGGW